MIKIYLKQNSLGLLGISQTLTADEINLYINVCVDYINLKNIGAHVEKLNRMFEEADEQQDMTVRLAELLKD